MFNKLSLRTVLGATIGALALVVVGLGAYLAKDALQGRHVAQVVEKSNATADLLLSAAGHYAVERGRTNTALNAPGPLNADDRAAIDQRRAQADAALDNALAALRADGRSEADLAALTDTRRSFALLRKSVDGALVAAKSARSNDIIAAWVPGVTRLIEVSQALRLASDFEADATEARLSDLQRIKHYVWVMSEFAGRERAALGGIIASGEPLTPAQVQQLAGARGQFDLAWSLVEAFAAKPTAPASVKRSVEDVRQAVFMVFQPLREAVYRAGNERMSYPVNGAGWVSASTAAIDRILRLGETVGRETALLAGSMAQDSLRELVIDGLVLLLGFAITATAFWIVLRRVVSPLTAMTHTTSYLAGGETNIDVPCRERGDEVGELAGAIEVFRLKLAENKVLTARQQEEDALKVRRAQRL
ncbi:nitrate- and nitrite sensing domain-containing protein, partial [Salinarimonas soli]